MDEDDDDMFQPAYARAAGGDEGVLGHRTCMHARTLDVLHTQRGCRQTACVSAVSRGDTMRASTCRCKAREEESRQKEGGSRQQAVRRQEAEEGACKEGWHESKARSQAARQEVISGLTSSVRLWFVPHQAVGLQKVLIFRYIAQQSASDLHVQAVCQDIKDGNSTEPQNKPCPQCNYNDKPDLP